MGANVEHLIVHVSDPQTLPSYRLFPLLGLVVLLVALLYSDDLLFEGVLVSRQVSYFHNFLSCCFCSGGRIDLGQNHWWSDRFNSRSSFLPLLDHGHGHRLLLLLCLFKDGTILFEDHVIHDNHHLLLGDLWRSLLIWTAAFPFFYSLNLACKLLAIDAVLFCCKSLLSSLGKSWASSKPGASDQVCETLDLSAAKVATIRAGHSEVANFND